MFYYYYHYYYYEEKNYRLATAKTPHTHTHTHRKKEHTHTLEASSLRDEASNKKKYFSILMREIIHNNMALGKEEFLSDSFSSFNYLVGKPNTQLVVSVRQKQSVSEKTSERV